MLNRLKSIPWRFVPVILIFCVLPFIIRLVHFNLDTIYQSVYHETTLKDWFFYYKSIAFILLTIWMLICMVVLRKKLTIYRDKWFKSYYLLGGIFIMVSLLSSLASPYQTCSTLGAPTRFEGIGIIISYIIFIVILTTLFILFACKSQGGQVGVILAFMVALIAFPRIFKVLYHHLKHSSLLQRMRYSLYTFLMITYIILIICFTGAHTEILNMLESVGVYLNILDKPESMHT